MKSILKYINESLIITESLKEPALIRLSKQIKDEEKRYNDKVKQENISWRDPIRFTLSSIISHYWTNHGIAWDQITDKELTIYEPDNKKGPSTVYKLLKNESDFIGIILIEDPKTNKFTDICIRPDGWNKSFTGLSLNTYGMPIKTISDDKISYIKYSVTGKRIYVYNCENLPIKAKRVERDKAKAGIINFDEKSLDEIRQRNLDRYNKALREIRAKRESEKDIELVKNCKRVINKLFELLLEFDTLTPPVEVLKLIEQCGGIDWSKTDKGIIKLLYNYLDSKKDAGHYKHKEDEYKEAYTKLDKKLKDINTSIDKIYDNM